MVDTPDTLADQTTQDVVDVRPLNDADFLKMTPEQYTAYAAGTPLEDIVQGDVNADTQLGDDGTTQSGNDTLPAVSAETVAGDTRQDSLPGSTTELAKPATSAQLSTPPAPTTVLTSNPPTQTKTTPVKTKAADPAKPDAKTGDAPAAGANVKPAGKLPDGVTQENLVDFYSKITGPIKADGKEVTVRSPEDAIKLIQMGFNYSRRMHELKPVRALGQMLSDNNLADPEKLNFLIDLSKGKKEAIQRLLADHKIDPIDLDTSKPEAYKPAQYQMDPKDQAFKDAIDATVATEGGQDLIIDINKMWDAESKSALREQPLIFQNLLDQKQSGVYEKIKKELEYQQSLGYLQGVPFLQAYHQVGTAMQKAGVFNPPTTQTATPLVPPVVQLLTPIDTGTRKATAPKNVVPTPQKLSSILQPRVAPNAGNPAPKQATVAMSDAEFMKLPVPR